MKVKTLLTGIVTLAASQSLLVYAAPVSRWVNPFIGTSDYGTCNPGALTPNGLMSVSPFNVTGSDLNRYDKDRQWWSTPYDNKNTFLTGFSHVNLSGVGCPDLGSLLVMATTGDLDVDYHGYGSTYGDEQASPGYYAVTLDKYGIRAEATATPRSGKLRFTGPDSLNILLNLGQGLTNESGASVRKVSDREWEGSKLMGTFCYNPQAVFPVYFVMRLDSVPARSGYWKKQPPMTGIEAQWDHDNGRYKLYPRYSGPMAGDDIGVWARMPGTTAEVSIGVSMNSIDDARRNLDAEQPPGTTFDALRSQAAGQWEQELSKIQVTGGTDRDREIFYTALYHCLVHPTRVDDVGEKAPRYSVFSLWDTYRTLHPLLCLVYPDRQLDMLNSILDFARHNGHMPRWELFGQETLTMEGDPAIIVIADTYLRGIRGFDIEEAYKLMKKSATSPSVIREDYADYDSLGYVPIRGNDNSVSHALEYYVADAAMALMADELGYKDDAKYFRDRSLGYKNYFDKATGMLRPKRDDGTFYSPFDPADGANFSNAPGYHEGSAWNYAFAVPHDYPGLARLMGGKDNFLNSLRRVFTDNLYDPANEPDIAYPFIFAKFGHTDESSELVHSLLHKHYTTSPGGLPGNDDAGTMSAWVVWAMMGLYPDVPSKGQYIKIKPVFDSVTINGKRLQ